MGDSDHENHSAAVKLTGRIMVAAIIVLFIVVVIVLFLHLYAKLFWWRVDNPFPSSSRRRRRRFVFNPGQDSGVALHLGLAPSTLKSIPVVVFNREDFKDGLECAVCLSEILNGEKARLLPKCNHGFHVDCIDMWFQSHPTCPLCRNPVEGQSTNPINTESRENPVTNDEVSHENLILGFATENPDFPTNVLFWGNESQISSAGASMEENPSSSSSSATTSDSVPSSDERTSANGGMMVIDIPETVIEDPSQVSPAGEAKSPVPTRLRSLKRLLSREKRVNSPGSCSSSSSTLSSCAR